MGRARSQTQAVAVDGFVSVLGTRRGLGAAAQAQRDASEANARAQWFESAVKDFAAYVVEFSNWHPVADFIVSTYRAGDREPSEGYDHLVRYLVDYASTPHGVQDLATVAMFDEPVYGFADPAVQALGQYFASTTLKRRELLVLREQAKRVISLCLSAGDDGEAHYQRLLPICQGIGQMLARASRDSTSRSSVCVVAANALKRAPAAALTGPLRSWVEVFAQRVEAGISAAEREALEAVIIANSDDDEFMDAFAEVENALERALSRATEAIAREL
jgi:hypothetical protein